MRSVPTRCSALFALIALIAFSAAVLAQPAPSAGPPHYRASEYAGQTLSYTMITTGSLTVEDETGQSQAISVELRIGLSLDFGELRPDGSLPFVATLGTVASQGFDESIEGALGNLALRGEIAPNGAIRGLETPPALAELGLDFTDLLLGLVVPAPQGDLGARDDWTARFTRGYLGPDRARTLSLVATYTDQGVREWGNRPRLHVSARLRGETSFRQGNVTTMIQEIGHALFYLQPETGIVDLSSVSVITTIESSRARASDRLVSKVTLTTTLERTSAPAQASGPVSQAADRPAAPAPSTEPVVPTQAAEPVVPPPAEPAPVAEEAAPPVETPAPAEPDSGPEGPVLPEAEEQPIVMDSAPDTEVAAEAEPGAAPEEATAPEAEPVAVTAEEAAPEAQPVATPAEEAAPAVEPAVETEDEAAPEPDAAPPAPALAASDADLPSLAGVTYRDPAGRFLLELPPGWEGRPVGISLRGTSFQGPAEGMHAYIYFMPLPSPAATAINVARSALTAYQETERGFTVLAEPAADTLGGETAYRALYRYQDDEGETFTEWGLFARKGDRAVYLQVAVAGDEAGDRALALLEALKARFTFGPTPHGEVPVSDLEASLEPYHDPDGIFSLLIPRFWPLTERAPDGSTTTFTEVGENAYLTLFAQSGARGFTAGQIVSAWKEQWSTSEAGFELVEDVTDQTLANHSGVRFSYRWSGRGGMTWTRRLYATVVDDLFFALVLDFVGTGSQEHDALYQEIIGSFTIHPEAFARDKTEGASEPSDPLPHDESAARPGEPSTPTTETTPPTEVAPATEATPATQPTPIGEPREAGEPRAASDLPEPDSGRSVLLLGRILTRYPGDGDALVAAPASGAEFVIEANGIEYAATTDAQGYIFLANLPPLDGGRLYRVARLRGTLFGFDRPVTVSFDNLEVGQIAPQVAYLRNVVLTLHHDYSLDVDVSETPDAFGDAPSIFERFIDRYPGSGWTERVREAALATSR